MTWPEVTLWMTVLLYFWACYDRRRTRHPDYAYHSELYSLPCGCRVMLHSMDRDGLVDMRLKGKSCKTHMHDHSNPL